MSEERFSNLTVLNSHKKRTAKFALLCEVCETGPPVYRPYPRRLESLIIADVITKTALSPQLFLRPWVLVRPGFELATSRLADRRSPN